jgi:CTP:molybdopterin cytidylyltransferase MocA
MTAPAVLIFHRRAANGEPALVRWLADVRADLARRQANLFERAGAHSATWVTDWYEGRSFGEVLAQLAPTRGGVITLGSGAVPRLNAGDARRLVEVAASGGRHALTNNRYSSDIVALGSAAALGDVPPLPSDNALPRWLEERAGFTVSELPARERLALDLDTPLDVCLATLAPGAPRWLARVVAGARVEIPRLSDLRALATDPHAELLVFGRAGSTTLAWLERNVRCRVRFLAEERGLRAASPLAIAGTPSRTRRGPRATLSMLLAERGPSAFAETVANLADGALVDSRVLLAARLGADESGWPSPADRFNSDLHRAAEIADPWLRELTASAAAAIQPILLGGHSLVGPGVRLVLGRQRLSSVGA